MQEHFNLREAPSLPDSVQGCRERMAALQSEITSIRIQIATTDIRRQTEKKTLDAAWFHRAKTALRLKRQELAQARAHMAGLTERPQGSKRDAFKDALIEVVRAQCDDEQWAVLVTRARALNEPLAKQHG
jgi:hypothetical protein